MPIVNIQGVGLVNFPDEMSREQINSAIEKEILPKFPEVQAQVPRGIVGGAKDIGASFVSGVGNLMQLPGQISELVGFTRTGDLPEQEKTGIQALGADIQRFGEEAKSPTLVAKEQLRAREIGQAEGFFQEAGAALRTTATDPALLTSFFAEQVPNLIGTYGFGVLGKGGAKLLMKEATEQAMAKVGVGSAVAGGAVMQGTDVGYDTYQTIYKQLRKEGVPDEEAQGIALAKGRVAALEAAGLSLASARLPGGTAIERALVGKGMPGTAGFLKSTVGETLSEALEEGGGAFAKQVGIQEVFPETDLLQGVGAATALGGLGGALFGAPAGVVNALRARPEMPPPLEPGVTQAPPPEGTIELPPESPAQLPPEMGIIPPTIEQPPVETFPPVEGVLPPETPTGIAPPTTTVIEPPKEPPKDALKDYFTGLPEGSEIVFQNRDRSTQASIMQMQNIAANPDYSRVSESKDFGTGAPVTISNLDLPNKFLGRTDTATLPDGTKVPVMYAVVPAPIIFSSNLADGSTDPNYTNINYAGLRAIAGNGRIAGLKDAYQRGTAEDYKKQLIEDKNHGVSLDFIKDIPNPILVRIMPQSYVTPNIADLSNRPTVARLSPIDTAKNDVRRFELGGLEFNEDGTPSGKTLMQFINAMPIEERTELTDKSGRPTTQAIDRLSNAIFFKAYGSEPLIDLYAQAADPEAKTILNALARVAPKMAELEGAGEYDVRNAIIQAAELAVNARRSGMNLKTAAQQTGLDVDPNSALVLDMFADNVRSSKKIADRLGALADEAYKQTQAKPDMFGEVPRRPLADIFGVLKAPPEEPGLFGEPTPEAPTKPEPIDFEIEKPMEQIAKEVDGMTIPEISQWTIDNAPNTAAREVAKRVKAIVDQMQKIGLFQEKVRVRNGGSRWKAGTRGQTNYFTNYRNFRLQFNGLVNNKADRLTGTRYPTILHELVHVATVGELGIIGKDSQVYQDLEVILKKVKKQIKEDQAAGVKDIVISRIAAGSNTVKNVKELVAWGLTDSDFQLYLSKIKVGKKSNLFNELVEAFRKLLGIDKEYETALEAVVRATDQIFQKPVKQLQIELALQRGIPLKSEEAESIGAIKTQTPAFKNWFGNSKVVNEDGSPLVVYHGTKNFEGNQFKPSKKTNRANNIDGYYFTSDPREASNYSLGGANEIVEGAEVIPVYLSIKKPFVKGSKVTPEMLRVYQEEIIKDNPQLGENAEEYARGKAEIMKERGDSGRSYAPSIFPNISFPTDAMQRVLKAGGYDGFQDGSNHWVAFNANQIKSAIGNKGTFSPVREEIDEERAPWEQRETPNAFGREIALTEMYNRMENAYDETASPDEAYDLAYENATQEEKAILRQLKKDGMLGFDYPHQAIQAIIQEPQNFDLSSTLKSSISRLGNKLVKEVTDEESIAPMAVAKAKEMLQKRKPIPMGAFADVDPKLVQLAQPVFYPQQKTIIDRIEGLRDNFWKKTAQGIADQFRAIKDYSEEGYMQARLSKTVDGALEGLTFFGQVFNDSGALNIKQGTKGLMDIMKPIGQEVDRYQMWVALNRESQLPMEKRTKMPNMGELIKRRNEFAAGTIDGKPRLEVYEKVRSDMNSLNKSVLKVALDAGLIDSSRQKIEELKGRDFLTSKDREILTRDLRAEIERIENKKAMNITEDDKDILRDYRAMIRDINATDVMTDQIRDDLIKYYTDNPGAYERFSADINYIPFYRAMEDGDLQGASTASGLTNQQFSRELTGGERPYGDLMENTLRNWSHILSASMKNQAVNTIMRDATNFGAVMPNLKIQYDFIDGKVVNRSTGEIIGDGSVKPYMTTADKGTVKMMNDGQPIYYRVLDPMLLDSISSIGYMGPKSKFLDVARDFKNMLQFGVTISPAFKVRNLFRDSISAIAVTDLKKNPFANVIEGWVASNRNNPAHISALAGGAIFNFGTAYEGDQSKLIKRLLDQGVDANTILDSPEKVKKGLTVLWEKYKDWGNKSEAANRMALYNQLKARGYDHLQASFYARDLLDFSMQGSWPAFRLAAQTIPFLNARVQGLYKLGRDGITPTSRVLYNTITGKEIQADDAQKARAFGYTTLAVAMASMLLYMAFKDDEEFQKREAWDRDNFWWFRLPGMDAAFRVPKPFEIGAFGTMAERVLEQIVDQGAEGKAFGDSVFRMLTDTFAINPIPQVIRPLVDIYANKDAFTGAPIESAGMERLSKQERATDATSPIAQALGGLSSIFGEKLSLSPVQVDYAIKAYFGWLGGTATQASVYATLPFRDGAYPDIKVMDKISQGFVKTLPADQSRFVTSFYENNKEINQAYADMRHYAELGETEKVQKILEEKGNKIALNKMYDKTAKEMANIRAQIRVITNDKTMDGTTKREMIDRMKQILSALAEQAETTRKSLKQ